MLCAGFASSLSEKVTCPSILDFPGKYPSDDHNLVQHILPLLSDADLIVTWYGGGFDMKFVLTKCVEYRLIPPPFPPHLDLWVTPYKDWLLTSNRLKNVEEFLNLPDTKTAIKKTMWRRARAGDTIGLNYVIRHCRADVRVLKAAYYEMLPYVKNHPTMTLVTDGGSCPTCVTGRLRKNGIRHKKSGSYQQYICRSCHHYASDARRFKGVKVVPL